MSVSKKELLWRLYSEHREQKRYHGNQRAQITHCVLIIAAAIIALIELGNIEAADQIWLGIFLIVAGGFGAFLTRRHSSNCRMAQECTYLYLDQLFDRFRGTGIKFEEKESEAEIKIGWAWVSVNMVVAILGFLISILGVLISIEVI